MAYNVLDIARKLIKMADDDIANGGDNLTNLKLQKLLYYEQGFHLSFGFKDLRDISYVKALSMRQPIKDHGSPFRAKA